MAGCNEVGTPKSAPLIVQTTPPAKQEFRWTNGKLPKSFDPALASAPPETDVVRAIFEGLTEIDARTLREIPGVAERWTVSDDSRAWTFHIRPDARWSNGNAVAAQDFVRSWTRLAKMGTAVPHHELLANIQGVNDFRSAAGIGGKPTARPDFLDQTDATEIEGAFPTVSPAAVNSNSAQSTPSDSSNVNSGVVNNNRPKSEPAKPPAISGLVAQSERILKVTLVVPDPDFAKLVASPIFRPTFDEIPVTKDIPTANLVTNGAFRVESVGPEGVRLAKSDNYWDKKSVGLESVRFVPRDGAEKALEAYRNGEIDAVTNADFEPLALKLLTPFDDFRQITHSAVNFYAINFRKEPFADRRVRQALAMAIERHSLTEGELEGSTRPALSFLPFGHVSPIRLAEDRDSARQLLEDAGFPDGLNFPVIRLVINRNDVQQRVARLVARMWKRNLNINTEIIVKGANELEALETSGDYDMIRRGVVLPSNDEAMSLISIFGDDGEISKISESAAPDERSDKDQPGTDSAAAARSGDTASEGIRYQPIFTEDEAVSQLRAIPLYFPTSYSLVKPYVSGFEINGLDAPSLKSVHIDNNWQPK